MHIEGNICIPYQQLRSIEQLGPYRQSCLDIFGIQEGEEREQDIKDALKYSSKDYDQLSKADRHACDPLHELWLRVVASDDTSSDWALFGHQKINKGSNKIGRAFPYYIPLVFLLDYDLDPAEPLSFQLFFKQSTVQANMRLDQGEYKRELPVSKPSLFRFNTPHDMLFAIILKHKEFCRMQFSRVKPGQLCSRAIDHMLKVKFGYGDDESMGSSTGNLSSSGNFSDSSTEEERWDLPEGTQQAYSAHVMRSGSLTNIASSYVDDPTERAASSEHELTENN